MRPIESSFGECFPRKAVAVLARQPAHPQRPVVRPHPFSWLGLLDVHHGLRMPSNELRHRGRNLFTVELSPELLLQRDLFMPP